MSQIILTQQLTASLMEALCCGELVRAEHLATSIVRLDRVHIDNLLDSARRSIQDNDCIICDTGYVPREYLVTAIVSTYKAARFIKGRLENLLEQSLGNQLEILVIDSASPENEAEVVHAFQQNNSNICYFRTDHRESIYQAWNRGVKAAKGRYLTNANADDRLHPDALERMVAMLEVGADVVYADAMLTCGENESFSSNSAYKTLYRPDFTINALLESCITGSHPVWRRSLHYDIGYFDIACTSAGDYDFFIRAASKYKFFHLPEILGLVWTSTETFSGNGLLPNMEFYATRERYHDLLMPTGNDLGATPETAKQLEALKVLILNGNIATITDQVQNDPWLCHEIGLFCEKHNDNESAWRYLQRAYYLAPENHDYRNSMARVLCYSLHCSLSALAGEKAFTSSSDLLMTAALAAQLLDHGGIATWCYATVLEFAAGNAACSVNLEALLQQNVPAGGVL